jgi:hypothetical protein
MDSKAIFQFFDPGLEVRNLFLLLPNQQVQLLDRGAITASGP